MTFCVHATRISELVGPLSRFVLLFVFLVGVHLAFKRAFKRAY